MNPGIYRNLTFDEYRAIDAWSPSSVKPGLISMKKLRYCLDNPTSDTATQMLGSAMHCAILEPDRFYSRYVSWDGIRRGKKYDEFCDTYPEKTVLNEREWEACLAVKESVRSHALASWLLTMGEPSDNEVSLVWLDPDTELRCKGRPDRLLINEGLIIDVKTTGSNVADERNLKNIATRLGYHISEAAYQAGVSALTGEIPDVKMIFVEQNPPHDVRVMSMSTALVPGYDRWQGLLRDVADCERSGVWPGCSDEEVELTVWDEGTEYDKIDFGGIE